MKEKSSKINCNLTMTMVVKFILISSLLIGHSRPHPNAAHCETDADCAEFIDSCCGSAEPTNEFRDAEHHICWSK